MITKENELDQYEVAKQYIDRWFNSRINDNSPISKIQVRELLIDMVRVMRMNS